MKDNEKIEIIIGKDEDIISESIDTMPNLLIGGTVMSGKTTYINTIISTILLTKKPNEVKFVIFDSKKIDYSVYNKVPHLLWPIINDSRKLEPCLQKISVMLDQRIDILKESNAKNLQIYNAKNEKKMYSLIVIIDDYSTLNSSEDINNLIEYISCNGWKVNIYMIISANHPTTKVLSTISKANFPARLSFKVTDTRASQIIIDQPGAEKLKGFGEALYTSRMSSKIKKVTVPYIADSDIDKIVEYWSKYDKEDNFLKEEKNQNLTKQIKYDDPLYNDVIEFAAQTGKISASLIQRRFAIGYNRAAQIVDLMEERGLIGPQNGSKPREVYIGDENNGKKS